MIAALLLAAASASPHVFFVKAGRLFDGTSERLRESVVLRPPAKKR